MTNIRTDLSTSSGGRQRTIASPLVWSFACLVASGVAIVAPSGEASAAVISVGTTADVIATDGACSLREAIVAANTDTAVNECTAGGDPFMDIITIAITDPIVLAGPLPDVVASTRISGELGQPARIDANGTGRVFTVRAARLDLYGVDLTGGVADRGGAILAVDSNIRFEGATASGNRATVSGGAIELEGDLASAGIYEALLTGNTAPLGGAVHNTSANGPSLANSTISGNVATTAGGGIHNEGGRLGIEFSTIADNTAPLGAGIFTSGGGDTTLWATIVADSGGSSDIEAWDGTDAVVSRGDNVIEDVGTTDLVASPTDAIGVDALLAPLADNTGPTHTHALLAGSPAIDRVGGTAGFPPDFDQRRAPRPQGAARDSGAFERCGPSPIRVGFLHSIEPAVLCFNEQTQPGNFVIELDERIELGPDTLVVDNQTAGAKLTIVDVDADGGHIRSDNTALSVTSGTLLDIVGVDLYGSSSSAGGAVDNAGVLTLDALSVSGSAADGGGVHNTGDLAATDVTFGGSAAGAGGGLDNSGSAVIHGSRFHGGHAVDGGAIHNDGTLAVTDSEFGDFEPSLWNTATRGGGIHNTGTASVERSLFWFNRADQGAAILNEGGDLAVVNSSIGRNTAAVSGGGVENRDGRMLISLSTISENGAPIAANIGSHGNATTTTTIEASIVQFAATIGGVFPPDLALVGGVADSFVSGGFNVIVDPGTVSAFVDGVNGDAVGAAAWIDLGNVGGPTWSYRLSPSIAVDRVTGPLLADVGHDATVDQRGYPRGAARDAGASEACESFPLPVGSWAGLDFAVQCFNSITDPGTYRIDLTADVTAPAGSPPISAIRNLVVADIVFELDGHGHQIDAAGSGPGIYIEHRQIANIHDVRVTGGARGAYGVFSANGGIDSRGTLRLSRVHLYGNDEGVRATDLGTTITDSTISDNALGGITAGNLTMIDSTVARNGTSTSGTSAAGGIDASAMSSIVRSTITGNTGWYGGGIGASGPVEIVDSTITGNHAGFGGGIAVRGDHGVRVVNSTLSGNTATQGGGLYVHSGSVTIVHTTITANSAPTGSGVATPGGDSSARATLEASVVAGNTGAAFDIDIVDGSGDSLRSNGGNVVGSTTSLTAAFGGDVHSTTPLLGPLADNDGPTLTHAPLAGSPVIGAVTGATPNAQHADQRGVSRPQAIGTDAGSVEARDSDADGVVDVADNCTAIANPAQADNDGDTQGDACDPDDDDDTVIDALDNCPMHANPSQLDRDRDGIGDVCDPDTTAAFTSLAPARYADTRPGAPTFDGRFSGDGARPSGSAYEIQVAGRGDVPADATSAVINLTTVAGTGPGYATAYPCTAEPPTASSVNYLSDAVDANEIVVKLSPTGTVCVFVLTTAHLLVDVVGFTDARSPYIALPPARYADTRPGAPSFDDRFAGDGIIRGGAVYEIDIAGRGGVPSGAGAVTANVTVTGAARSGFLTMFPCGTVPTASSLNYEPGTARPNELVAKLSATGSLCAFALTDVHLIVDIVGYLPPGTTYTPLTPTRYADTRPGAPTFDGRFSGDGLRSSNSSYEVEVAGRGSVPADASSVTVNITVTGPSTAGYITVHPCGTPPTASSLNYTAGTTRPNELVAKLSPTGTMCVYALTDVHLVVDAVGYTTP